MDEEGARACGLSDVSLFGMVGGVSLSSFSRKEFLLLLDDAARDDYKRNLYQDDLFLYVCRRPNETHTMSVLANIPHPAYGQTHIGPCHTVNNKAHACTKNTSSP